jgi:hypothetical protein
MKQYLAPLVIVLAFGAGTVHAQDTRTPQQNRMAQCNQDAGARKGDERKAFMSECLKNKPAATAQQERMKTCNAQAKDMKGDARKAFMSECLKKKA